MTRKVFSISEYPLFCECIKTDDKENPYRLYRVYHDIDSHGFYRKHRKLEEKYADLASVLHKIRNVSIYGTWEF